MKTLNFRRLVRIAKGRGVEVVHTYKLTGVRQNSGYLKSLEKFQAFEKEHGREPKSIDFGKDYAYNRFYIYHENLSLEEVARITEDIQKELGKNWIATWEYTLHRAVRFTRKEWS